MPLRHGVKRVGSLVHKASNDGYSSSAEAGEIHPPRKQDGVAQIFSQAQEEAIAITEEGSGIENACVELVGARKLPMSRPS